MAAGVLELARREMVLEGALEGVLGLVVAA